MDHNVPSCRMRRTVICVLVFWLIAATVPPQAQSSTNAVSNKKVCDFLSKAEAESILGQPVELRDNNPYPCKYVEIGWTNKPPKNRVVSLSTFSSATPKPNHYADAKKNAACFQVVKEVPDFADAAVWLWIPGFGGTLYAFKGGTIQVEAMVNGLPEDVALQQAKALAAKVFGGSAGTGYVYVGTPKGKAAAAATIAASLPRGGTTFTEAPSISSSDFIHLVKEASLTVVAPPSYTKYIPMTKLQPYLVRLAAYYGIAVRPDAPVSLQVTIDEVQSDFEKTVMTSDYRGRGSSYSEDFHVHNLLATVQFFVRAAVWRNGAFHPLVVAPVSATYFGDVTEARDLRKQLMGDETVGDMWDATMELLTTAFKELATNKTIDETPWPANAWSDREKGAASGQLPAIPTPPPGAGLVKLGNSILAMMSMTLGVDVLAADSEEKLANMSFGEVLDRAQENRRSACALSGFASNMGIPPSAC
jgi:hypothetical protein